MLFLTQGYAISSIFKSIDGKYFHNNVLSPYIFAVIFDQKTLNAATHPPSRSEFYRQALLIGLGVFAVLAVFQPFGTYVFEHDLKYLLLAGYGLLIPLTGVALREIIALIKPEFFDRAHWTFRRELVLTGLFLLGGVVMSYFYHHLAIGGRLSVRGFFWFVFFALTTVSLPMALLLAWRQTRRRALFAIRRGAAGRRIFAFKNFKHVAQAQRGAGRQRCARSGAPADFTLLNIIAITVIAVVAQIRIEPRKEIR